MTDQDRFIDSQSLDIAMHALRFIEDADADRETILRIVAHAITVIESNDLEKETLKNA